MFYVIQIRILLSQSSRTGWSLTGYGQMDPLSCLLAGWVFFMREDGFCDAVRLKIAICQADESRRRFAYSSRHVARFCRLPSLRSGFFFYDWFLIDSASNTWKMNLLLADGPQSSA